MWGGYGGCRWWRWLSGGALGEWRSSAKERKHDASETWRDAQMARACGHGRRRCGAISVAGDGTGVDAPGGCLPDHPGDSLLGDVPPAGLSDHRETPAIVMAQWRSVA